MRLGHVELPRGSASDWAALGAASIFFAAASTDAVRIVANVPLPGMEPLPSSIVRGLLVAVWLGAAFVCLYGVKKVALVLVSMVAVLGLLVHALATARGVWYGWLDLAAAAPAAWLTYVALGGRPRLGKPEVGENMPPHEGDRGYLAV